MNRRTVTVALEWIGALAGLVLAVWCWNLAQVTAEFSPVAPGQPSYEGTEYSGAWIALAAGLVTVSGLLVIDSVRRLRSGPVDEHAGPSSPPDESSSPDEPSSPDVLGLADGVGPRTVDHRGAE
ncbi:hypothetical protein BFN03_12625 [Rhodococcus sp. WMMA185]|uniref:hypothetical protein n=1 Tax=Rhodococcus sp. WMMA185 TaxID=679318 RepID=UPI000877FC7A|nr:hypothetical protein [Rhodococcus sp. WMMA185]AOW93201.1 hypothetical protein BFN03_12625 [Rhodococcus sp. WMMA185]